MLLPPPPPQNAQGAASITFTSQAVAQALVSQENWFPSTEVYPEAEAGSWAALPSCANQWPITLLLTGLLDCPAVAGPPKDVEDMMVDF